MIINWVERLSNHTKSEILFAFGSSGEYWSMSESLNQHFAEMIFFYLVFVNRSLNLFKLLPKIRRL